MHQTFMGREEYKNWKCEQVLKSNVSNLYCEADSKVNSILYQ